MKVGEKAKNFSSPASDGSIFTSDNNVDKIVVLFFLSRNNTMSCTLESINFSKLQSNFIKNEAIVFGISRDCIYPHNRFCKLFNLNLTLLSDKDDSVCEQFGVLLQQKLLHKTFLGIKRSTFLINKECILVKKMASSKCH